MQKKLNWTSCSLQIRTLITNLFVFQNEVLFPAIRQLADYILLFKMLNEKS